MSEIDQPQRAKETNPDQDSHTRYAANRLKRSLDLRFRRDLTPEQERLIRLASFSLYKDLVNLGEKELAREMTKPKNPTVNLSDLLK